MFMEIPHKVNQLSGEKILLKFTFVVSICIYIKCFYYMQFGFDFSDEGFYLNWISHPEVYKESVSQFGFLIHPFYILTGYSVVNLRFLAGFLILGLSYLNSFLLYSNGVPESEKQWTVPFLMSTVIFNFYQVWLPTPNYNTLNLISMLIASLGIIYWRYKEAPSVLLTAVLLSFSLFVAFLVKPTSFVGLTLFGTLTLITSSRKLKWKLVLYTSTLFIGLVICSSYFIDHSIFLFVDRIVNGLSDAALLNPKHKIQSIIRFDRIDLSLKEWLVVILMSIIPILFFKFTKFLLNQTLFILLLVLEVGVLFFEPSFVSQNMNPLFIYVMFFISIFMFFLKSGSLQKEDLAIFIFFLTIPFIFAFGTDNNFWFSSSLACIFWVYAFLYCTFNIAIYKKSILSIFLIFQILIVFNLVKAWSSPYRQKGPFHKSNQSVKVDRGGPVWVAEDLKVYIGEIQVLKNEIKGSSYFLDLSGHFPGVAYVLGSKALGKAWFLGGYEGRDCFAEKALSRITCDKFAESIVMTEEEGPLHLSNQVLSVAGLNLISDFKLAKEILSPWGYKHRFYIPKDGNDIQKKCEINRHYIENKCFNKN